MTWICASCETEQNGDRLQHFVSKHRFRPKQTVEQKQEEQRLDSEPYFFSDSIEIKVRCPECRQETDMVIKQNLKSIVLTCENSECQQVKLYRLVIDRKPVLGEIDVTV